MSDNTNTVASPAPAENNINKTTSTSTSFEDDAVIVEHDPTVASIATISTTKTQATTTTTTTTDNNAISEPPPPQQQQQQQEQQQRPLRVAFVHLDWGIGGAEQLMLQLAQASVTLGHSIQLYTTRCDPTHCFAPLQPNTGTLYPFLHVWGSWIPQSLGGSGRVLCSTIRLLYLVYCLCCQCRRRRHHGIPPPDVIVLDGLPTPLPLLQYLIPTASLLFYCHFPDQLLTTAATSSLLSSSTNTTTTTTTTTTPATNNNNKGLYRTVMDAVENWTMPYADCIVVNSQFTRDIVQQTFAFLQDKNNNNNNTPPSPGVLYPALDTTALDMTPTTNDQIDITTTLPYYHLDQPPIVSLNRYERKKNLKLLLQAILWIYQQQQQQEHDRNSNNLKLQLPPIVIAGGYDPHNMENIEYRGELQHYVEQEFPMELQQLIYFRQSISDMERTLLLQHALAVVYTPTNEHFGIVPIEAMYCQTPVVAVNSGGPKETIIHGVTGFLCPPEPAAFGQALVQLLQAEQQQQQKQQQQKQQKQAPPLRTSKEMGQAARDHVIKHFGQDRFLKEWNYYIQTTIENGQPRQTRQVHYHMVTTVVTLLIDLVVTGVILWMVLFVLRLLGMSPLLLSSSSASQLVQSLWMTLVPGGGGDDDDDATNQVQDL